MQSSQQGSSPIAALAIGFSAAIGVGIFAGMSLDDAIAAARIDSANEQIEKSGQAIQSLQISQKARLERVRSFCESYEIGEKK